MDQKKKISARQFLEDFRSQISESELMDRHGLDRAGLGKVYKALIKKGALTPSDIEDKTFGRSPALPLNIPPEGSQSEFEAPKRRRFTEPGSCPQCGATVGTTALTCPECGHAIPGEERWSKAEPKQRFMDRISPWVLGCLIAIPIGIIMFYVFRDIIIPISEKAGETRAQDVKRKLSEGKTAMQSAKDLAQIGGRSAFSGKVETLIGEDVLQSSASDYKSFTGGARWPELSRQEKINVLTGLRKDLQRSSIPVGFDFYAPTGELFARVNPRTIDFADAGAGDVGASDQSESTVEPPQPTAYSPAGAPALPREIQRRLQR